MIRFLRPRLIAATTALALAATTLAPAPASAMSDNDRAMLGLILGIGAIAAIADQAEPRHAKPHHHMPPPPPPHRDFRRMDHREVHRRAEACVVRIERDRHGNRVEIHSPGCRNDRSPRRGPDFPHRR